ncbi:MAG: sugar transferase, partial [Flavobacterium sp.]
MFQNIIKPFFDRTLALIGLILTLPLFLIMSFLLALANSGSPYYFQYRPGKNCKIFRLIKFKTMTDKLDIEGNLLPDVERLTKIGKFVRKTSLDELPQL